MKTKTEIRNQIKHLYTLKKQSRKTMRRSGYSLSLLKPPEQIIDFSILSLKWVLGYKAKYKGLHYWCFRCGIMHRELTCPKCGNSKLMELKGAGCEGK